MKKTEIVMGMPVTVEILDSSVTPEDLEEVFNYFKKVDRIFSTYKPDSEISKINAGLITPQQASAVVQEVLELCRITKAETFGFFDILSPAGWIDPSGMVKGWAIFQATKILDNKNFENYYIEAGGDIQIKGSGLTGQGWRVGVKNPFKNNEIVKAVLLPSGFGMATSGTYERGQHIYNPHNPKQQFLEFVSLTVIGPNIYEADRFATAAFAMGEDAMNFLEAKSGLEGYLINKQGIATLTSGFSKFVI